MKKYEIRHWNMDLEDTSLIWQIWKERFPMMPLPEPQKFFLALKQNTQNRRDMCTLVFFDAQSSTG